jgi:hypothetical protein
MFSRTYRRSLLDPDKLRLIDRAFRRHGVRTFADLGGVWRVEGGYSFYAASKHSAGPSFIVDTHPTKTVEGYAKKAGNVSIVKGGFGDPAIAKRVAGVDAVFLFDVLLHQVRPNWNEVLELYSDTRVLVIYNQQWIGPETVRLFDLGEEEFFQNVPHSATEPPYNDLFSKLDTPHPDYTDRNWREVHHIWQWGITDLDLIGTATRLGYKLEYFENYGRFGSLPRFENHGMIFVKR